MKADTELLKSRSQRAKVIASYDQSDPLVVMQTNMPGHAKHHPAADVVLKTFKRVLEALYKQPVEIHRSSDGDYAIMPCKRDVERLKNTLVYLEENHPLGRLVDLDVHYLGEQHSRRDLGMPPRRCFLCEKDVNVCRREGNHSVESLVNHFDDTVRAFLKRALAKEAIHALRRELFTYPCFGLVSHRDSGIHTDMNISHFLSAFEILKEAFETYLSYGLHKGFSLSTLREQGKRYELTLLKTVGANTHKGAHYLFGLILPFFARSVMEGNGREAFLEALKKAASTFESEDLAEQKTPESTGEKAYQSYRVRGIRGEIAEGLPSIYAWYPGAHLSDLEKLIQIMMRLDDTTLLKGEKGLLEDVKRCMREYIGNPSPEMEKKLDCLKKNVSPGGAADMLALVFFLERSDYLLE